MTELAPSTRPAFSGTRSGFRLAGRPRTNAEWPARLHRYARTGVRSRQQLLTYLSRGGVPPRTASRLIAECEARGFVDDSAGARLWAGHWARQGYGWAAIRAKLEARGFSARAIGDAAARSGLAAEDESRARAVIAARRRTGRGDRARLARVLGSRGFDPDLIERLLNDAAGHSVSS